MMKLKYLLVCHFEDLTGHIYIRNFYTGKIKHIKHGFLYLFMSKPSLFAASPKKTPALGMRLVGTITFNIVY